MKKWIIRFVSIAGLCAMFGMCLSATPAQACAVTSTVPSCDAPAECLALPEMIVEVESEEDIHSYPKNPNYRYTFIWVTPSNTRAVCYNCGKATMSVVNRKSQYGSDYKQCPLSFGAGLSNDDFYTWDHYSYERCTACGYRSEEWYVRRSYSVYCNNYAPGSQIEWQIVDNYVYGVHDIHQDLSWWL